jgi:hypothetical protein
MIRVIAPCRPGHSHAASQTLTGQPTILFLPVFSAALAVPDLPALILSEHCNGIRGDFKAPTSVNAARSMSSAAKS